MTNTTDRLNWISKKIPLTVQRPYDISMACSVSWLQTVRTHGTVRLVYLCPIADRDLTAQDPVSTLVRPSSCCAFSVQKSTIFKMTERPWTKNNGVREQSAGVWIAIALASDSSVAPGGTSLAMCHADQHVSFPGWEAECS